MSDKIFLMRPDIGDEEYNAVKRVLDSYYLTEGPVTQEFEKSVANYVGARHGIAMTSCTTALHAVLEVIGVKGKKVIVPDYTYPATAEAVVLAGGIPVLVDVDLESMNMNSEILEKAYEDGMNVFIPVSWAGVPLESKIYKKAKELGLFTLEDAACSLGAMIGNEFVGKFADFTCFSFHPRKVITTGEGGMITTDNDEIAEKCHSFKHFGSKEGKFSTIGTNYKLSNILSAVGVEQMKKIESIIKARIEKAKIYDELLEKILGIKPAYNKKGTRQTYQSYACYIEKDGMRDKIRTKLAENNIESQIGTYSLHLEPAYQDMIKVGKLENSELLFRNTLTLPLHNQLSVEEQERICKIISNVIN
ncbi:DegT/DnrJ/EryC1/StrS family aminotransferase [Candidatus Nitrosotenuis uzonensis]|uniref:DegT/DnrJ/EryC1/StrS aminotransferase family protein n=1 Tax=Candidatus Nitrosotenuis uzonensis TaxID=1407055 RepID=V6AV84_9ARCH|nr:DegT/DnrJ/EryC1/StrS family aminotransferase [Candidatus Nitrosotenuis uzonensis]CDI06459.1 DegT/DnrJ/EryC1/StrS aminotransferase family protein [Candidatus Nitrosotenuis uzonensis]